MGCKQVKYLGGIKGEKARRGLSGGNRLSGIFVIFLAEKVGRGLN